MPEKKEIIEIVDKMIRKERKKMTLEHLLGTMELVKEYFDDYKISLIFQNETPSMILDSLYGLLERRID